MSRIAVLFLVLHTTPRIGNRPNGICCCRTGGYRRKSKDLMLGNVCHCLTVYLASTRRPPVTLDSLHAITFANTLPELESHPSWFHFRVSFGQYSPRLSTVISVSSKRNASNSWDPDSYKLEVSNLAIMQLARSPIKNQITLSVFNR